MKTFTSLGIIRDAVPEDIHRVVDIYNAAIPGGRSVGHVQPVSVESRQEWFDCHDETRRPLWVLERDDDVLAWASLQSWSSAASFDGTAEVSVYVAPEYCGQGLGTLLLGALVAACPSFGIKVLLGFTFGHNEPTIRMNRRLGFDEWGHLRGVAVLGGLTRDLLIFGLRFPSSPVSSGPA